MTERDPDWNRKANDEETRIAYVIIGWFAACVLVGVFSPKVSIVLLAAGFLLFSVYHLITSSAE